MKKTVCTIALIALLLAVLLPSAGCPSTSLQKSPSIMVVSPWGGYGAGSYAHYKIPMADGSFVEEKHQVIDARPNQVTIEISMKEDSGWESIRRIVVPPKIIARKDAGKAGQIESLTIKGQAIQCWVEINTLDELDESGRKVISKTWISDKVPGSTVLMTYNDRLVMQLVDFEIKPLQEQKPEAGKDSQ